MKISTSLTVSTIAICAAIGVVSIASATTQPVALKSVPVGSEYHATTTDANWSGATTNYKVLNTGSGTFGSVVISKSTIATITVYDATTTDSNQRTGNMASSTLVLADIAASASTGTYTYDIGYRYGLLVVVSTAGGIASSTITFR